MQLTAYAAAAIVVYTAAVAALPTPPTAGIQVVDPRGEIEISPYLTRRDVDDYVSSLSAREVDDLYNHLTRRDPLKLNLGGLFKKFGHSSKKDPEVKTPSRTSTTTSPQSHEKPTTEQRPGPEGPMQRPGPDGAMQHERPPNEQMQHQVGPNGQMPPNGVQPGKKKGMDLDTVGKVAGIGGSVAMGAGMLLPAMQGSGSSDSESDGSSKTSGSGSGSESESRSQYAPTTQDYAPTTQDYAPTTQDYAPSDGYSRGGGYSSNYY